MACVEMHCAQQTPTATVVDLQHALWLSISSALLSDAREFEALAHKSFPSKLGQAQATEMERAKDSAAHNLFHVSLVDSAWSMNLPLNPVLTPSY